MNLKKIIYILLFLFHSSLLYAENVVIVETAPIKPYEMSIEGFKKSCRCNILKILPLDLYGDNVLREINRLAPDTIVAVGEKALTSVMVIRDIPILYMMVFDTAYIVKERDNISGVNMMIAPEKQLLAFLDILPETKTIGMIYTPDESGYIVEEIRSVAYRKGVSLMAFPVYKPKEIPGVLDKMSNRIDAFWILPDMGVANREILELLALFSMNFKVPLLSFTNSHLGIGAFVSLDIDPYDIGMRTGAMIDYFESMPDNFQRKPISADIARVSLNQVLVSKMDLTIGERFRDKRIAKLSLSSLK